MHTQNSGQPSILSICAAVQRKKSVNFQFYEILNAGAKHRAPAAVDRETEKKMFKQQSIDGEGGMSRIGRIVAEPLSNANTIAELKLT